MVSHWDRLRWAALERAGHPRVPHPHHQRAGYPHQPFQHPRRPPWPVDQPRDRHHPGDLAVFHHHGPVPEKGLALVVGGQAPGVLGGCGLDKCRGRPCGLAGAKVLPGPGSRQGLFGHHGLRAAVSVHGHYQRRPGLTQTRQGQPSRLIPADRDSGVESEECGLRRSRAGGIRIHARLCPCRIRVDKQQRRAETPAPGAGWKDGSEQGVPHPRQNGKLRLPAVTHGYHERPPTWVRAGRH